MAKNRTTKHVKNLIAPDNDKSIKDYICCTYIPMQTKFFSTQMDVDKIIGKSDREVTLMKTVHGIQTKYYTHDEN